ncbi:MAG: hypothetical protein IBJ11_11155 [Phycisphaerales bacterium]|nr:hypothetical protein [Phycisphaerales bacterium]
MILPLGYALLIWGTLLFYRRRWQGFLVLFLSVLPIFFAVRFADHFFLGVGGVGGLGGSGRGLVSINTVLGGGYGLIVLFIGIVIVVQRRRALAYECRECLYDLRGAPGDVCPECGHRVPRKRLEAARAARAAGARPAKGPR